MNNSWSLPPVPGYITFELPDAAAAPAINLDPSLHFAGPGRRLRGPDNQIPYKKDYLCSSL